MALAVPLSRFTSRVGGGSAFYVRLAMTTFIKKGKWDGLAALVWVAVVLVAARVIPVRFWERLPEMFPSAFWTFGWWPPALILAVSGLWRGNVFGRVCAVVAIIVGVVFECWLFFAHAKRA